MTKSMFYYEHIGHLCVQLYGERLLFSNLHTQQVALLHFCKFRSPHFSSQRIPICLHSSCNQEEWLTIDNNLQIAPVLEYQSTMLEAETVKVNTQWNECVFEDTFLCQIIMSDYTAIPWTEVWARPNFRGNRPTSINRCSTSLNST